VFELFVNPWMLGGLALSAVPVIIHLLNKRRFDVHPWAAMEFLLQAQVMNRRRVRLEDLILLALRVALIALIVFAIARPVLRGFAGWREDERVVVVDDSGSMHASEAMGTTYDQAREAARNQVLDALGASIPVSLYSGTRPDDDVARVSGQLRGGVLVDDRVEGAESDPELAAAQAGHQLIEGLRTSRPIDAPLRLGRLFERLEDTVSADSAPVVRNVVLLSDLRRADWVGADGKLDSDIAYALEEISKQDDSGRIRLQIIHSGSRGTDNVAVSDFRVEGGHLVVAARTVLAVDVTNHGKTPRANVRGAIEIGRSDQREIAAATRISLPPISDLAPGETRTVEVLHTFDTPGEMPLRVSIDADVLARDDESFLVARVREGIHVLVFDDSQRGDRLDHPSGFLVAALSPYGSEPAGVVVEVSNAEISKSALADADVVIIVNRESIRLDEREALGDFALRGGGIAWFLGDRVARAAYSDGVAVRRGESELRLFPAELRDTTTNGGSESSRGGRRGRGERFRLELEPSEHPLFSVFRGTDGLPLDRRLFFRTSSIEPGPDAVVLARFDDSDRSPAVIEATVGEGRVTIWNTSADRSWSDWPTDLSFPVILHELVRHLAPVAARPQLFPGDPVLWEPEAGLVYEVVTPDGRSELIAPPPGRAVSFLSFSSTWDTGFYRLMARKTDAPSTAEPESIRWFACRFDPAESELASIADDELKSWIETYRIPVSVGTGIDVDAFRREQEGEIWRWLAFACAILLLVELLAAWWFGRK
jgi:hypothetical protein